METSVFYSEQQLLTNNKGDWTDITGVFTIKKRSLISSCMVFVPCSSVVPAGLFNLPS